jgi:hypothetical protein
MWGDETSTTIVMMTTANIMIVMNRIMIQTILLMNRIRLISREIFLMKDKINTLRRAMLTLFYHRPVSAVGVIIVA